MAREQRDGLAAGLGGGHRKHRRAVLRRENAACLEQHRRGPGDVPQRRAVVVHEVEAAERDVAEMEGRRAEASQAMTPEPAVDEIRHARAEGRAHRKDGAAGSRLGSYAQWSVVQPRAAARARREQPPRDGIVDGTSEGHPIAKYAHRDRETWHAPREIVGAVDRVEDPGVPPLPRRVSDRPLLADEPVGGKQPRNLASERLLDRDVRVRHEGAVTLDGDLRAVEPFEGEAAAEERQIRNEPSARFAADALVGAHLSRYPAPRATIVVRASAR